MIRKMFSLFVLLSVLCGFTVVNLNANGLNLNGMGTKAIAMGGAFIGLADDYSAVFWNPAGLTQMKEAKLSFFLTDIIPSSSYTFAPIVSAETANKMYPSGALAYYKPLSDKLVVGLAAYVPSGVGAKWDGADLKLLSKNVAFEWESMLAIITVSPTIAYQITDSLSVGATININFGSLSMNKPAVGQYEESSTAIGFGSTIGLLYKPSDQFSIGVSMKTPMKAKFSGDASMAGAAMFKMSTTSEFEREATLPFWAGVGIAFKPSDKLTITADIQYTNWKKVQDIPITYQDAKWELLFSKASNLELRWEDKIQLRFGVEYRVSNSFALRAGYYNDPSPAPLSTLNILLPQTSYNWISAGFGYSSGCISIDFAVEKAFGEERVVGLADALAGAGMPGVHKTDILVPNLAFTYKFGKK
jgi:long-chain fatty acid transport protein